MNDAEDSAARVQDWLASLSGCGDGGFVVRPQGDGDASALALLAAGAVSRGRSLLVVTADNHVLTGFCNAVDLGLRPLCLVLPDAPEATPVAARATLSLLTSRLARIDGETDGAAWAAQRQRLDREAALWRQCQDWNRHGRAGDPWPARLAALFPVCVLPLALARRLDAGADWVAIADADRQPAEARAPWPAARATVLLASEATLSVPAGTTRPPHDDLEVLTQELSELELELATAHAEIAAFTHRYHELVGSRMATLDALRADIAARHAAADPDDLEAARAADAAHARAEHSRRESGRFTDGARAPAREFVAGGDLKKLYRKLAQQIHPDRAGDEDDRAWRTQLMAEANRAYSEGDESALREVFALWQEGGNSRRPGSDADAAAQIARLKRRIAEIIDELNRLFGSKLYELFTAAGIARRVGRDLLQEMASRLDEDIAAARRALA